MANVPVTINIPSAAMPTVIDAFAAQAGWDRMDPATRPPKEALAKQALIDYVVAVTVQYYGNRQGQAARDAAEAQARGLLVIT